MSLIDYSNLYIDDWLEFENNERVAMVYARQQEYGTISSPEETPRESMGQAEHLWYAIRDAYPGIGRWMGSYASGSPEELNFLQAADLFAYELVHEFENQLNRPSDPMRWALAQLLPDDRMDFCHCFHGLEYLLDLLIKSNRLIVTKDQEYGGSINSSLTAIDLRNFLYQRMADRRKKE